MTVDISLTPYVIYSDSALLQILFETLFELKQKAIPYFSR